MIEGDKIISQIYQLEIIKETYSTGRGVPLYTVKIDSVYTYLNLYRIEDNLKYRPE